MPLEERYMEKLFDLKCKYFLKKMETDKFYSYEELTQIILASSHHRPHLSSSEKSANKILDLAYVEAVIQAQYAVGNLRCGERNGQRFYSKSNPGSL
jgi:hypothetical protein